ncbi:D-alanyl-D-alanine carboxypeptidase family protein [Planctomicrobium sp. SH664]|uniref:D-alanyl-D-alanine carboxypeptidase family protein n=1 Tax=Planctomicrobium sp. SH664 TaxID=3448125 RepID=UPI003F5BBE96
MSSIPLPSLRSLLLMVVLCVGGGLPVSWAADKAPPDDLSGPPFVSARNWAIADGKTGELLWGHREAEPVKAASTTKIMCAYVVLRLAEKDPGVLEEMVTFSPLADATTGSTADIHAGESLPVRECLYGLLLPSGNDAGNALAEHFNDRLQPPTGVVGAATSRSNFIAEMNRHATQLGMKETVYRSPFGDGGTRDDRTTSPRDLLKLAHTAMQIPRFRDYVGTVEHTSTVRNSAGESRQITWKNTNQLLGIQGFDGIKTGTTPQANACLVSSGHRGEDHLLVVVLGSETSSGRYLDSQNLYRWAWLKRGHQPTVGDSN